jgi:3,4-dihydroxy 2-butanone 4-phosphate synthase/GTP cyclohydrolase II
MYFPRRGERRMNTVSEAIEAIGRGEIVVVVDDEDRENEGDLIMAADAITRQHLAFFLEHTSGVICVGLDGARCDELQLPPMVRVNEDARETAFTVTVDVVAGASTGISAADRAATLRALADPAMTASDFTRPGHIFPLRARPGGVLERPGHTEAAVDLARLAGRPPAGALCEVVSADKAGMARVPELRRLAAEHGLAFITIADLIRHRQEVEGPSEKIAAAAIPTRHGEFVGHAWRSRPDDAEHLALVRGSVRGDRPISVAIHHECLVGDVFGAQACGCASRLQRGLAAIAAEGEGVLAYLRAPREVATATGSHPDAGRPDEDRARIAARMLSDLGVRKVRLLGDDAGWSAALTELGVDVVSTVPPASHDAPNVEFLDDQRRRSAALPPVRTVGGA